MATLTVAGGGGPHPEVAAAHHRSVVGGFVIFLLSESMFFVTLFATRFLLAGGRSPGVGQAIPAALTAVLLASVWLVRDAGRRVEAADLAAAALRYAGVALVALLVVGGVAAEWATNQVVVASRFGGAYAFTVGFHTLHVAVAVLLFAGAATAVGRGRADPRWRTTLACLELFWYWIVLMWVAVWVVVYLA